MYVGQHTHTHTERDQETAKDCKLEHSNVMLSWSTSDKNFISSNAWEINFLQQPMESKVCNKKMKSIKNPTIIHPKDNTI